MGGKELVAADKALVQRVQTVNATLAAQIFWSTQRLADYEKLLSTQQFMASKRHYETYLNSFMSVPFLQEFAALGFTEINLREKDINALTRGAFFSTELMGRQVRRTPHLLPARPSALTRADPQSRAAGGPAAGVADGARV